MPDFARPFAFLPMPGLPDARYLTNGQMPVCPLPEVEKTGMPAGRNGHLILNKMRQFPFKNKKNTYSNQKSTFLGFMYRKIFLNEILTL